MADQDAPDSATERARKAELEVLFRAWDQRGDGEGPAEDEPGYGLARMHRANYGVRLRFLFSLVLVSVTALVMFSSRSELAYWLTSGEPTDLGDLRARWAAGERTLDARSNAHVSASGLVPTRVYVAAAKGDDGRPTPREQANRIFFCPLFNLVVQTRGPVPEPEWHRLGGLEIDHRFADLVRTGLVDAADLTVSVSASGRLLRGADVPQHLRRFVTLYHDRLFSMPEPGMDLDVPVERRSRLDRPPMDPDHIWVLVDGEVPSDKALIGLLWGLAAIVPLVSILFLLRAIRLRARLRVELRQAHPGDFA